METKNKKSPWYKLSYETLPYKLHYVLFCAAKGGILPYMIVFLKERLNLSGSTIATLLMVRSFIIVLCKPAIGMIVDYFNKLKAVMLVLTFGELVFYYLMLLVPRIEPVQNQVREIFQRNYNCLQNGSYIIYYQVNEEKFDVSFKNNNNEIPILHCNGSDENYKMELIRNAQCTTKITNETIKAIIYDKHNLLSLGKTSASEKGSTIIFNCFHQSYNLSTETEQNKKIRYEEEENQISFDFIYQSSLGNANEMEWRMTCEIDDCEQISGVSYSNLTMSSLNSNPSDEYQPLKQRSVYTTYQYYLLGMLLIISGICTNAMFTLSDTACYECLQRTGEDYGKQRLWGAVGWGLISPASGFFNDLATGENKTPNFMPGFYIFGILTVFEIINLVRLDLHKPPSSHTFFKDFRKVLTSKEFDVFLIAVFIMGIFTSFVWHYLMVYIEHIGGTHTLMGLVNTVQCFIGEIPLMFFSGTITKKIGPFQVVAMSFMFFSLRYVCYYFIKNPWWLIPIEPLHGLTYAIFYTAMTSYAKASSLPGTEATTQSILCVTYEALGVGVGAIVTGTFYDHFGYHTMFLVACISTLCCSILLWIISLFIVKKRDEKTVTA